MEGTLYLIAGVDERVQSHYYEVLLDTKVKVLNTEDCTIREYVVTEVADIKGGVIGFSKLQAHSAVISYKPFRKVLGGRLCNEAFGVSADGKNILLITYEYNRLFLMSYDKKKVYATVLMTDADEITLQGTSFRYVQRIGDYYRAVVNVYASQFIAADEPAVMFSLIFNNRLEFIGVEDMFYGIPWMIKSKFIEDTIDKALRAKLLITGSI